jgi:diguanylate cyclase (GGDEF)-like protein/PAS domain S-box-containing protein
VSSVVGTGNAPAAHDTGPPRPAGAQAAGIPVPPAGDPPVLTGMFEPVQDGIERLWSALAVAPLATAILDATGRFLRVNQALCDLVGHGEATLLATGLEAVLHPEDADTDLARLTALQSGEQTAFRMQQRCRRADGEVIPVLASTWLPSSPWGGTLHLDRAGRPRFVIRQLVDLREGRRPEDRLAWRATHDALTGLPNRTLLLDRLEMVLAGYAREPGMAALLVLDLDHVGAVADRFGFDAVDRLLMGVARRLTSILRSSDTVARLSSDEFAVLCPGLGAPRDAARLAERIISGLATPFAVADQEVVLQASIGVAIAGPRVKPGEAVLLEADAALRLAKRRGGTYELADASIRTRLSEHLETERALRRALDAGELRALYQPIVSLREGRLAAAEALVRWERPEGGQLGAGEFLPFAEECGLIVPIGAWLLEEACRQAERWRRDGSRRRPVTMHVNLSERQFTEPHLIDLVAEVLSATGTEPDQLCLEVGERVLSLHPASAATTLKRLAGLGVRVAVDDFGTGHSSVTSLDALPISALKIDRSLVARLDLDPDDDAVAAAVVGLAHTLDLLVIAEGVETPRQLAKLDQLGCDLAQGYLFARPEPGGRAGELLGQDRRWQ